MLPRQQLYHPALPAKINNKLMFEFYRKYGVSLNKEYCSHNDADQGRTDRNLGYR